ncbi:hypothetical protein BN1708_017375, partial [Verticillium longisporum]
SSRHSSSSSSSKDKERSREHRSSHHRASGLSVDIPKGRPLSTSQIKAPKPMSPHATRHILDADYCDDETIEELTARFGAAGFDEDDMVTDFSNSPVSSTGSSLSYRSDSSSPSSSLSGYSTPGSDVSSCTCERYGITRKGERVKIDCGGDRCGYGDSSSDCSSSISEDDEYEVEPASYKKHSVSASGSRRNGIKEQDEAAAVFILEPGATLRNAIIGPAQAEGVHCRGPCTIENVWWDDVCEDAATFKGAGPRYVRGGGAREASDKVFQHNGEGWLHIDGFYANKYGKFYRSCGNCSQQFQRHVNITNFVGIQGTVVGVNQNYGDTAELSDYCLAKVGVVCTRYNGCVKPCEAGEVGEGELEPFCKINGDDWS